MLLAGLWALTPQELIASDPLAYAQRAFALSHDHDFGVGDVFDQRVAVTEPVAWLYSMFGVGIRSTNLWPLLAVLVLTIVVWLALPDPRSRIVGAVVCATSVPLFGSSLALFPDIVAAAFMAASSLILFERRRWLETRAGWLAPVAAVTLLFVAFLAKESAYWVLPLWLVAWIADARSKAASRLQRGFHLPALGAALVLGLLYLGFCRAVWGDAFARLTTLQALTGHHLWSWDRASASLMARRLTVSPVRLLLDQYGIALLALALFGFVFGTRPLRAWKGYAACCLFFFWFGSTSFTRYEPLPLLDRMTLPILPAFYVLAAYAASRIELPSPRAPWLNRLLPIAVVLAFTLWPFIRTVTRLRANPLAEANAMSIIARSAREHPEHEQRVVCADIRSPGILAFYFGFHYPANLHVLSADDFAHAPRSEGGGFVFIRRSRSRFLSDEYGTPRYDEQLTRLGLPTIYESGDVSLHTFERAAQLAPAFAAPDSTVPALAAPDSAR
jgi:hypothetical protein